MQKIKTRDEYGRKVEHKAQRVSRSQLRGLQSKPVFDCANQSIDAINE